MIRLVIIVTAFCLAGGACSQARAADYVPVFFDSLYDVPVMPGLQEVPEMALTFDKPSGRIVQAAAYGESVSAAAVLSFYAESLPQLGWVLESTNSYVREEERLRLETRNSGGRVVARFLLEPR